MPDLPDYISSSEYESVSAAGRPVGSAPNAQYQQVGTFQGGATYALVLRDGDELFAALIDFAKKVKAPSARYRGVGALRDVYLGWLNREKGEYLINHIDKQTECVSMIGSIGHTENGDLAAHTHMSIADETAMTYGGHLTYAIASPTMEIFVDVFDTELVKRKDQASGITLFDLN